MTNSRTADAQLDALYGQIPAIPACNGSCWRSCGPIDMSARERERLREAGYEITPPGKALLRLALSGDFACDALTAFRRCGAYGVRPAICRLWGAAEGMECPRGCQPEGGYLTAAEGARIIGEALRIGGDR